MQTRSPNDEHGRSARTVQPWPGHGQVQQFGCGTDAALTAPAEHLVGDQNRGLRDGHQDTHQDTHVCACMRLEAKAGIAPDPVSEVHAGGYPAPAMRWASMRSTGA